jgi:uncharacterized metal-binding protein YceD (DUF177 family)
MIIRLDQISDEPYRWRERREVPVERLDRVQLVALGEVSWAGAITPTPTGHLFSARLEYLQTLSCPRCLKPSSMKVETDIELLILPQYRESMPGDRALEEADLSVLFVEDENLDTEPILMEQLQLNVPMRRLCREDCAGLCPVCGTDRNFQNCSCGEKEVDPRWAALAKLRDSNG